jgi:hypothetical protein
MIDKRFKIKFLNRSGYLLVTKDQLLAILENDLLSAKELDISLDQYMSCKSEKWPIAKN